MFGAQRGSVAMRGEVPAVGGEHGAVHGVVQLAQADDVGAVLGGIVEAVVGLGQPLVARDHERGAVVVIGLAGGFEGGGGFEVGREGEVREAVCRIIAKPILQRRTEEPRPSLMSI